jgi:ASC-1-like (ASCH) protein
MEHIVCLNIRERPFEAIKRGLKKVEVRANKECSPISLLNRGNTIIFANCGTNEKLFCIIDRITHYKTVRDLLIAEGVERTLSSGKDLEGGIESIESIGDYKQVIKERGVFAIVLV